MPRTFRFEHFTVGKSTLNRGLRRRDKQHLSEKRTPAHHGGALSTMPHYGRNHAETEELFLVRAMNAQLEALAGLSANAPLKPTATNRGQPIGALPLAEVPVLEHGTGLGGMLDEAMLQVRAVQSGLEDVTRATRRLLSMPMEAARAAAQRLRFAQG